MKTKIILVLILALALCLTVTSHAASSLVYIAEPQFDSEKMKTGINIYDSEGTMTEEISVNGIMPRMSPDGSCVAFIKEHEKIADAWRLCVSKPNQKEASIMAFTGSLMNMPVYSWSPQCDKLSVFSRDFQYSGNRKKNGYKYEILIFDFVKGTVTQAYNEFVQSMEKSERSFTKIQWFPDNVHLLLSKQNETFIINTKQNTSRKIFKDALCAFTSDKGKSVISLSSPEKWTFNINHYNIRAQKSRKLYSMNFYASDSRKWYPQYYLQLSALSHDSRFLIFRNPNPKPLYIMTDIRSQKNLPVHTKGMNLIFQNFSPDNNRLISAIQFEQGGVYGGYGTFDLESAKFKTIKEIDKKILNSGEQGLFLIQLIYMDWIKPGAHNKNIRIDQKLKWDIPEKRKKRKHSSSTGRLVWKFKTQNWVQYRPAVDEKTVYFTDIIANLYAIERLSGKEKWKFNIKEKTITSPVIDGKTLYFGGSAGLYALDAEKGKEKWNLKLGKYGKASSPVVRKGIIYCGDRDEYFYAVNAAAGIEKWKFKAEKVVNTFPVFSDEIAYFGAGDHLYAIEAETAKELWKLKTGRIWRSPFIAKDNIYFGSSKFDFHAVNRKTGKSKWTFKADGMVYSSPSFADSIVYFGSDDGYFYALDADTGKEIWKFEDSHGISIRSSSFIIDKTIYFGSGDGYVYGLSLKDGKEIWNFNAKSSITSPLTHADGIIYFGTSSSIYAVAIK